MFFEWYALNIGAEGTDGPGVTITSCNEGLEGAAVNVFSGSISIQSTDDCINAANADLSGYSYELNISGGTTEMPGENLQSGQPGGNGQPNGKEPPSGEERPDGEERPAQGALAVKSRTAAPRRKGRRERTARITAATPRHKSAERAHRSAMMAAHRRLFFAGRRNKALPVLRRCPTPA